MDVYGSSEPPHFSCLEKVLQSEFTHVHECDSYAFATSSELYQTIGHLNDVEKPPLRFGDIPHLQVQLWDGETKT